MYLSDGPVGKWDSSRLAWRAEQICCGCRKTTADDMSRAVNNLSLALHIKGGKSEARSLLSEYLDSSSRIAANDFTYLDLVSESWINLRQIELWEHDSRAETELLETFHYAAGRAPSRLSYAGLSRPRVHDSRAFSLGGRIATINRIMRVLSDYYIEAGRKPEAVDLCQVYLRLFPALVDAGSTRCLEVIINSGDFDRLDGKYICSAPQTIPELVASLSFSMRERRAMDRLNDTRAALRAICQGNHFQNPRVFYLWGKTWADCSGDVDTVQVMRQRGLALCRGTGDLKLFAVIAGMPVTDCRGFFPDVHEISPDRLYSLSAQMREGFAKGRFESLGIINA